VNGVHYDSFRDVACVASLIEEDNTLDDCLTENSTFQMPSSLRRLFATILVFCQTKDVASL
jgi:ATP-dependent DNA helicase PIF1